MTPPAGYEEQCQVGFRRMALPIRPCPQGQLSLTDAAVWSNRLSDHVPKVQASREGRLHRLSRGITWCFDLGHEVKVVFNAHISHGLTISSHRMRPWYFIFFLRRSTTTVTDASSRWRMALSEDFTVDLSRPLDAGDQLACRNAHCRGCRPGVPHLLRGQPSSVCNRLHGLLGAVHHPKWPTAHFRNADSHQKCYLYVLGKRHEIGSDKKKRGAGYKCMMNIYSCSS